MSFTKFKKYPMVATAPKGMQRRYTTPHNLGQVFVHQHIPPVYVHSESPPKWWNRAKQKQGNR